MITFVWFALACAGFVVLGFILGVIWAFTSLFD